MTTCSSSFRALCLSLAVLAARVSADPRPQTLATFESLPAVSESESLGHHARSGDNDYDRGQEYMLAMPQGSQPSPAVGAFDTDIVETADGEDADRGWWKQSGTTATLNNGALVFEEYSGNRGADVREYLHRQQLPVASHTYEVDHSSALGGLYNLGNQETVFRKYIEQQRPIVSKVYDDSTEQTVLNKYIEHQQPIFSKVYDIDTEQTVLNKYIEHQRPIVRKVYDVDTEQTVLNKYLEQQRPIVSKVYNVDTEQTVLRKYLKEVPVVTKTTEVVSKPVVRNSYSIRPVIKEYTQEVAAPVIRKSVTVLPPPVVNKLYKVVPAPVVRKYYTAPPVVQSVRASPPVFNKFVKNVYNLIKLEAPKRLEVPIPPAPTTPVPTTEAPTTTPLPVVKVESEALVAEADEVEAEAEEEQKLKSIGKMVVVETVRRVVDVPEFDGPAPPPARSEETVVEPDGTVRKFEKYIEYDQVSAGKKESASIRSSHSKKSSKSSHVMVDAVKTSTAASPSTARLMHDSALFPAPANMQMGPYFPRFGGFDSLSRTQFGKALSEPMSSDAENTEPEMFMPKEGLSEEMAVQQAGAELPAELPAEHLELPARIAEPFSGSVEMPAMPEAAVTVAPFAGA